MKILFIDPVCPKPYDPNVLSTEPLGGTEGTVIRIAEGLVLKGNQVEVTQHNRKESVKFGAHYTPFGAVREEKPTHVILLREPMALYQARKQFPNAKLYFWAHDIFAGPNWDKGFQSFVDNNAVPIVVSEWHKQQMYDYAKQIGFKGGFTSKRIYNPIADDLKPDSTPVDENKLVFFSSPHKGLEHTLKVFERFKDFKELKDMKLYVANPGYFDDHDTKGQSNVINLGPLPHSNVLNHIRTSFAVLHLNNVYPETFGLVHAECNAVGTPYLNSRVGANNETYDHPQEFLDVTDSKAVIDRLIAWKSRGRPKVRGNANFRLQRVLSEWKELLAL